MFLILYVSFQFYRKWKYIDLVMHQMDFSDKWRRWIDGCL